MFRLFVRFAYRWLSQAVATALANAVPPVPMVEASQAIAQAALAAAQAAQAATAAAKATADSEWTNVCISPRSVTRVFACSRFDPVGDAVSSVEDTL